MFRQRDSATPVTGGIALSERLEGLMQFMNSENREYKILHEELEDVIQRVSADRYSSDGASHVISFNEHSSICGMLNTTKQCLENQKNWAGYARFGLLAATYWYHRENYEKAIDACKLVEHKCPFFRDSYKLHIEILTILGEAEQAASLDAIVKNYFSRKNKPNRKNRTINRVQAELTIDAAAQADDVEMEVEQVAVMVSVGEPEIQQETKIEAEKEIEKETKIQTEHQEEKKINHSFALKQFSLFADTQAMPDILVRPWKVASRQPQLIDLTEENTYKLF
jgi:hypothetical protein